MLAINVIGCGRLGKTIASLIHQNRAAVIQCIVNSTPESATRAASFVGAGRPCKLSEIEPADLYFICSADDKIEYLCRELVTTHKMPAGAAVIHFSGSLTSAVLKSALEAGCEVASFHPVRSFADPEASVKAFPGTFVGYEGTPKAVATTSDIIARIGGVGFPIKAEAKGMYHAAGVIASNYLVGLAATARDCYIAAGVPPEIAIDLTTSLMSGTMSNLLKLPPERALTGPLQRGDIGTIKKHLAALSATPWLELYRIMGIATLPVTAHDSEKKAELEQTLTAKI